MRKSQPGSSVGEESENGRAGENSRSKDPGAGSSCMQKAEGTCVAGAEGKGGLVGDEVREVSQAPDALGSPWLW